jgi:hypothetical protein
VKIHLRKKKNKYAQVHENLLRTAAVSLKAKGLGAWLELHEDGFGMNYAFIEKAMKEGRESIQNAIKELETNEFLLIIKSRNDKGQFVTDWYFDSEGKNPDTDFTYSGNPLKDMPLCEISPQNIKSKPKKINQKISSKTEEDYENFRKRIKKQYLGKNLVRGADKYLEGTVISISSTGYLHNEFAAKDLTSDDAIKLWQWLYGNQDRLEQS